MPRIIAGRARGRRLVAPPGEATRPTSDRAREALFSALEAARGPWAGAHVIDLYAGSGALGLEALSRGATRVDLVEEASVAVKAMRTNLATVGGTGAVVHATSVEAFAAAARSILPRAVDVVLADPPYTLPAATVCAVLETLVVTGVVADGAVFVVERSSRDTSWTWPESVVPLRERAYGAATLWYGRAAAGGPPADG